MINQRQYEPDGDIWREAFARRGGKEFTGGPVCWDAANCEGVCRECRAVPEVGERVVVPFSRRMRRPS